MMRLCLLSPSLCNLGLSSLHPWNSNLRTFRIFATADGDEPTNGLDIQPPDSSFPSSSPSALSKDLKKVVNKTAATFAPRASTASKNPAVPGTTLYKVFEVQGYAALLLGGVLSFNLIFPSNEPDLWRLMGMWSIWMFTIPSLRARDCPSQEKEALNYLFLIIPLLNVAIPLFWKSFALVWSADTLAFFAMYAWKVWLLQNSNANYLALISISVFFHFLPLTTAWMAGKNRVDVLRMGLKNEDSLSSLPYYDSS